MTVTATWPFAAWTTVENCVSSGSAGLVRGSKFQLWPGRSAVFVTVAALLPSLKR